jgi:hypothetical protein
MSSKPPQRVKELRDRCRPGIANLPDDELLALSHFIIENEDINVEAWRDLARELMIQIQWEKDARIRRQDSLRTQDHQDQIHRRQHSLNWLLAIIAALSAVGSLGSLVFQYRADRRAAIPTSPSSITAAPPALPTVLPPPQLPTTKPAPTDTSDRALLQAPPPAAAGTVPPVPHQ